MSSAHDALSRNIKISEDERRSGRLSLEHRRLGALLLHCRGYVVLHDALELVLVSRLREAFQVLYRDCTASRTGVAGQQLVSNETKTHFWERNHRFRIFPRIVGPFADPNVLVNPFASPIVEEILGERYYCKMVSSDTVTFGAKRQAPHRDLDFYDGAQAFGTVVNIPIMHCGLHNGPIEVWPSGSHLWHKHLFSKFQSMPNVQDGDNPVVEEFMSHVPSAKLDIQPGDILIRDPGMWHRGTVNPTDEPRTMLTIGFYRRDFFYPYGDPGYNVDAEVFADLPQVAKPLFDYCFQKRSSLYWKTMGQRALTSVANRRLLGAPVRIGVRYYERLREGA